MPIIYNLIFLYCIHLLKKYPTSLNYICILLIFLIPDFAIYIVQVHWKMRPIYCAPHTPPSIVMQAAPNYARWRRARYDGRSSAAYPTACATAWTRNTSFPRLGKRPLPQPGSVCLPPPASRDSQSSKNN